MIGDRSSLNWFRCARDGINDSVHACVDVRLIEHSLDGIAAPPFLLITQRGKSATFSVVAVARQVDRHISERQDVVAFVVANNVGQRLRIVDRSECDTGVGSLAVWK